MAKFRFSILCCLIVLLGNIIYLSRYNFDFSIFVAASQDLYDCSPHHFQYIRHFAQGGSDGGYNYLAAQDPFISKFETLPTCAQSSLLYTKERILYHFTSWILAGGQTEYLHYSMFLVNLLGFLGMTFFLYRISNLLLLTPWELGALILTPGIWLIFRFSTVDMLWLFTVTASIYYFLRQRRWEMSVFLLLSLLSRSYSIGILLALLFEDFQKDRKPQKLIYYLLPLIVFFGLFKPWLSAKISDTAKVFNGESYFSLPLETFWNQVSAAASEGKSLFVISASSALLLLVTLCIINLYMILKTRKVTYENIISAGFPFLLLFLTNVAWSNGLIQLTRVIAPSIMVLVFYLKREKPKYLNVVIPIIYLISFLSLTWYIASAKVQLV